MDSQRSAYIINDVENNMTVNLVGESTLVDKVYLTKWLGKLDDYNQRVNDYTTEVLKDKSRLEREIGNKKDYYEARFEEERTTNAAIKALSSAGERERATHYRLRDLKKEILELEHELRDAEILHEILENKQRTISTSIRNTKSQWEANCSAARSMFLGNRPTTDAFSDDPDANLAESLRTDNELLQNPEKTEDSDNSDEKKSNPLDFDEFSF